MSVILIVCLWFILLWTIFYMFYWYVFRPVVLVRLRYRIFEARDRIRDLVILGEITESHDAFRLLEQRCRHALNVVAWANLLDLNEPLDEETKLRAQRDFELIKQSNPAVRDIHASVVHAIIGGLFLNSPGLWPLMILFGAVIGCFYWFNRVKSVVSNSLTHAWGLTYVDRCEPA